MCLARRAITLECVRRIHSTRSTCEKAFLANQISATCEQNAKIPEISFGSPELLNEFLCCKRGG